jgi:hypothetical protein
MFADILFLNESFFKKKFDIIFEPKKYSLVYRSSAKF